MACTKSMIKKLKVFVCAALVLSLLLFSPQNSGAPRIAASASSQDFRAVWVTTVLNLDWPTKPGLSVAQQKSEADLILDNAALMGLNAVV